MSFSPELLTKIVRENNVNRVFIHDIDDKTTAKTLEVVNYELEDKKGLSNVAVIYASLRALRYFGRLPKTPIGKKMVRCHESIPSKGPLYRRQHNAQGEAVGWEPVMKEFSDDLLGSDDVDVFMGYTERYDGTWNEVKLRCDPSFHWVVLPSLVYYYFRLDRIVVADYRDEMMKDCPDFDKDRFEEKIQFVRWYERGVRIYQETAYDNLYAPFTNYFALQY